MEVREVCRSLIYELYAAVLFTISLKCVNVVFLSSNDTNQLSSPRDKCVYYNRTTNNIFTSAYEGIPENLLLNFLGWMVGSRFHPVDKCVTHIHTSQTSGKSRPIDDQLEPQTAHFYRIKQLSDHFGPHNPLILSLISNFMCSCMAKYSGTPLYYHGFS
jgi:hypothetical protein